MVDKKALTSSLTNINYITEDISTASILEALPKTSTLDEDAVGDVIDTLIELVIVDSLEKLDVPTNLEGEDDVLLAFFVSGGSAYESELYDTFVSAVFNRGNDKLFAVNLITKMAKMYLDVKCGRRGIADFKSKQLNLNTEQTVALILDQYKDFLDSYIYSKGKLCVKDFLEGVDSICNTNLNSDKEIDAALAKHLINKLSVKTDAVDVLTGETNLTTLINTFRDSGFRLGVGDLMAWVDRGELSNADSLLRELSRELVSSLTIREVCVC